VSDKVEVSSFVLKLLPSFRLHSRVTLNDLDSRAHVKHAGLYSILIGWCVLNGKVYQKSHRI